ncbi:MAG: hypothetical protein FWG43_02595 [Clostridiales bacterium]|nr:hypothetical protein [Clostridiales bacterium]
MKNFLIIALVSTLFIFTACSQASNNSPILDDTTIEQPVIEEQPAADDAEALADDDFGIGSWYTEFDDLFLSTMNEAAFTDQIVGLDALSDYINDFIEPNKWEKQQFPLIYKIIQYFDIPEETFREYNSREIEFNNQHRTGGATYTDSEIAALYCGDEAEMLERLKSPYAFFDGQEVFNVFEILEMDAGELIQANFDLCGLSEYCDWVEGEMDANPSIAGFEELFDEFRQELATAQQMLIEMGTVQQELLEEELELE